MPEVLNLLISIPINCFTYYGFKRKKRQQNEIPQKWNFGDAQLEFPGRTILGILLLNKK